MLPFQEIRPHSLFITANGHQLEMVEPGQLDEIGIGIGIHPDPVPRVEEGQQRQGQAVLGAGYQHQMVRVRFQPDVLQPVDPGRLLMGHAGGTGVIQQPGKSLPPGDFPGQIPDLIRQHLEGILEPQIDQRRPGRFRGNGHGPGRTGRHKSAAAGNRLEQALQFAQLVSPGHRGEIDAQEPGQFPLGRQTGARSQGTGSNVFLQLPGQGQIDGTGKGFPVRFPG